MSGLILVIIGALVLAYFLFRKKPAAVIPASEIPELEPVLQQHVAYFRALEVSEKERFKTHVRKFLAYVRVHGVDTTVSNEEKILVAAGAVIPIFGFKDWHYYNLKDVLLYSDTFNAQSFETSGEHRNTLGMVGDGTLSQMMLLSKASVYAGFDNTSDKNNTVIHEFVHLLDKADGAADGVPEALLDKQYVLPWLNLIHQNIRQITEHHSDINPYAATNQAEFFAVASEYFFEQPEIFRQKHPELYELMEKMFLQDPPAHHN
ncbi:zinc-dependent peptidase [Sediminibacterium ginsengisoli]|uniref:Peptidase n=1 Tax=Sediminibacterium ginsengisoli TaxID=413434 RepID=A0A1T4QET2_9BACT|nr:M90 family metallopeptidase [Sediminibacterium ginsengisoli]SKA02146.1 hypothetical protein SAMN04488132_10881 [Sediminibacterium ginsengisoli]